MRCCSVFFFNDTATTEIYTLSLHDALPIWTTADVAIRSVTTALGGSSSNRFLASPAPSWTEMMARTTRAGAGTRAGRSEEHTSELQSQSNLVCRLLLQQKNTVPKSPHQRHN